MSKAEEVNTPISQKSKAKGEKKRKGSSKRTPEVVRDTPIKSTLRSADKKKEDEEYVDSEKDSENEEEDLEDRVGDRGREESPATERKMKILEGESQRNGAEGR